MPLLNQFEVVSMLLQSDTDELRQQLIHQNIRLDYDKWRAILTLVWLPQQQTLASHLKLVSKLKLIAGYIPVTLSLINNLLQQYTLPPVQIASGLVVPILPQNVVTTVAPANVFLDNTIIANLTHLDVFAEMMRRDTYFKIPAELTQDITAMLVDGTQMIVDQSRLAQIALAMHTADTNPQQLFIAVRLLAKSLTGFYTQLLQTPHSAQGPFEAERVAELRLVLNKWQDMHRYFVELLPHLHLERVSTPAKSTITAASIIPAAATASKTTEITAAILPPSPIAPPTTPTREAFFKSARLDPIVPPGTKAAANAGIIGQMYSLLQRCENNSPSTYF